MGPRYRCYLPMLFSDGDARKMPTFARQEDFMSEPTKETKHTPTPWKIDKNKSDIVAHHKQDPKRLSLVATCWADEEKETTSGRYGVPWDDGLANAELIVLAVNEREALLAQNDLLKKELQGWIDNSERWKLENDALFLERDRLLEALKKVYRAECFKDGHTVIEIHGKITDERHCMCMMIGVEKVISQSEKRS